MSRDPYYASGRGGGERWDTERFDRERARFDEPDRYRPPPPSRYDDEPPIPRYEKRTTYYDEEPRYAREHTIEKEHSRQYYSPSPPRRQPARPSFLRRQSSLDTFDRRPLARFSERERDEYAPPGQMMRFERERERDEYGPPARYREREREELREVRPPPLTNIPIPLPRTRGLPPPRRYAERDYEEIRVAEPDFYGDEEFRGFPERVREREIVRRRRRTRSRSRSRESRTSRGTRSVAQSVRSESSDSGSESVVESVRSEFPKRGKTRMPKRLVSLKAIRDLNYPYEEEVCFPFHFPISSLFSTFPLPISLYIFRIF